MIQELRDPRVDPLALAREEARDDVRQSTAAMRLVLPGHVLEESRVFFNSFQLTEGEYGGGRLLKPHTRVQGTAGSRFTRLLRLELDCVIEGVQFHSALRQVGRDNDGALVTLTAAARVVFRGCQFHKEASDAGDFVTIASGGKAEFIGCTFTGGDNATFCVNNAGAAGNVHILGCYRETAAAHLAVTTVTEMT